MARDIARLHNLVSGEAGAFGGLVREYHPLAYRLAFKVLHDHQDAEEVVQDAFLKIHRALAGFRGEAALKTWILRIVMRLSLNRRRDRARSSWRRLGLHQRSPDPAREPEPPACRGGGPTPETLYISRETRQLLLQLLDELPAPLREVLILNSFEELSYEEIARILQVPLGTVSSRIHSARKKLLKKLARHEVF